MELVVNGFEYASECLRVEFTSEYGRGWAVDWPMIPGGVKLEVGLKYSVQFHITDVFVFGETMGLSEKREAEFVIEGEVFWAVTQVEQVDEDGVIAVRMDGNIQLLDVKGWEALKAGDWIWFKGRELVLYPWGEGVRA